jgi:hypothetical protein
VTVWNAKMRVLFRHGKSGGTMPRYFFEIGDSRRQPNEVLDEAVQQRAVAIVASAMRSDVGIRAAPGEGERPATPSSPISKGADTPVAPRSGEVGPA